jgi:hypothetical protein
MYSCWALLHSRWEMLLGATTAAMLLTLVTGDGSILDKQ